MKTINQAFIKVLGSTSLFILALCGIATFLLLNNNSGEVNYFLVIQSLVIGLVAVVIILNPNSGLLAQVVGVFFLLAFSCFPILEVFTNTVYWGGRDLAVMDKAVTNFFIIIFLLLFIVGYHLRFRLPIFFDAFVFPSSLKSRQKIILMGVGLLCLGIVLHLYGWSFRTLFFRGGENHEELDVEQKSSLLLVEFFLRPLVFNIGLFLFYFARDKKILSILALCLGIYAVFPTGVPRFLAAAMYMPFLLHWAFTQENYRRAELHAPKLFLPNTLIFGMFFIFPFLDVFRWYSSTDANAFNVFGLDTMLAGHFDGYQMLVRAIADGELTYGYGFFGAMLFFVPRSIWPTKPIGSAQEVAHISNLSFDNVSMPLVGEFYLNFWYIGIIFGALLLGVLIRSIDTQFLRKQKYELSAQWLFYFQCIGLLLLTLRGSFLSAYAYSVADLLTWLTIWLICKLTSVRFDKTSR